MGEISLAALPPSKAGQVGEVVGLLLWELAGSEVEAGMGRVAGHCFPPEPLGWEARCKQVLGSSRPEEEKTRTSPLG